MRTELLRTIETYDDHVKQQSFGVKEKCIFNIIPNFHVVNNCSVDPMHDLFEGICRYDVAKMLKHFIYKEHLFSLDVLNERIQNFDCMSRKHFTIRIQLQSIKSELIILTASNAHLASNASHEMKFLVYNLPFIVGDLILENNIVWKLYLILRKIICIVMLPLITKDTIDILKHVITEYLRNYLRLFDTFKCKHHILVHYPLIMNKYGSLKILSCIRFEAKHKPVKLDAKNMNSRKNSAY